MQIDNKLKIYYFTAIFSLLFAVIGFSYNAWRLEKTEENSNIRTASFEVLTNLAELEQIIYAAHYDKNMIDGSPRKAWVKIGLIVDLSALIDPSVAEKSEQLLKVWSKNWHLVAKDSDAIKIIERHIDIVRKNIKHTLIELN